MDELTNKLMPDTSGSDNPLDLPEYKSKGWIFSLVLAICANLIILIVALKNSIAITEIIWFYWYEGLLLGSFRVLKLISVKLFSIPQLMQTKQGGIPGAGLFAVLFLSIQVPFHFFFWLWIDNIDAHFDYTNALLAIGGVMVFQNVVNYFHESRPWGPEPDVEELILDSCLYFLRFIPAAALYLFIFWKFSGSRNMTVLTVTFMTLKTITDALYCIIKRD